eukprot:1158769-Pelagomonas_calceolata.AAC.2
MEDGIKKQAPASLMLIGGSTPVSLAPSCRCGSCPRVRSSPQLAWVPAWVSAWVSRMIWVLGMALLAVGIGVSMGIKDAWMFKATVEKEG